MSLRCYTRIYATDCLFAVLYLLFALVLSWGAHVKSATLVVPGAPSGEQSRARTCTVKRHCSLLYCGFHWMTVAYPVTEMFNSVRSCMCVLTRNLSAVLPVFGAIAADTARNIPFLVQLHPRLYCCCFSTHLGWLLAPRFAYFGVRQSGLHSLKVDRMRIAKYAHNCSSLYGFAVLPAACRLGFLLCAWVVCRRRCAPHTRSSGAATLVPHTKQRREGAGMGYRPGQDAVHAMSRLGGRGWLLQGLKSGALIHVSCSSHMGCCMVVVCS